MLRGGQPTPGPHIGASLRRDGESSKTKFRVNTTGGEWRNARKYPDWEISEVEREIQRVIGDIPEPAKTEVLADLTDLLTRAEEGELVIDPPADFKELVDFSPILELRIQVDPHAERARDRYLLRFYFAEPEEYPRLLLGLSFARKPSKGDRDETQNRQIREARRRYKEGMKKGHTWGINVPMC